VFKLTKNLPRNADLQSTAVTSKPTAFFDSREQAVEWLAEQVGFTVAQCLTNLPWAYRRAAKKIHPDVSGKTNDDFLKLQNAKEILDR
jgi:hypothetical protein